MMRGTTDKLNATADQINDDIERLKRQGYAQVKEQNRERDGLGALKVDLTPDDKLKEPRTRMTLIEALDLMNAAGEPGTIKRRIIEKAALLVLSAIRLSPSLQRQMRGLMGLLQPQVDVGTAIKVALAEDRADAKKTARETFAKIREAIDRESKRRAPQPRELKDVPEINLGQRRISLDGSILKLINARGTELVDVQRDDSSTVFSVLRSVWLGLKPIPDVLPDTERVVTTPPDASLPPHGIKVGRILPRAYGGGVAYYVEGNLSDVTVNRLGGGGNNFKISRAMWESLPLAEPIDTSVYLLKLADEMDAEKTKDVIGADGKLTMFPTDQSSDAKAKSIGDWRTMPLAMGAGSARLMAKAEGYVMVRKVGREPFVLREEIWNTFAPSAMAKD